MEKRRLNIVDTTLRDGSHAMRHSFTTAQGTQIAQGLDRAGVNLIELSHGDGLGGSSYTYGFSAVSEFELLQAASQVIQDAKLTVLLLPGIGTIADLERAYACGVRAVRVAPHITEADVSAQHIRAAKDMGMMAVGFLMMAHMSEPEAIAEEAKKMESYGADYVNLADSAGHLQPDGVRRRMEALQSALRILRGSGKVRAGAPGHLGVAGPQKNGGRPGGYDH